MNLNKFKLGMNVNKHLLGTYCIPGMVVSARETFCKKPQFLRSLHSKEGRQHMKGR